MLKEPLFAPLPIPFSAFSREASIRDPGRKARACSTIVGHASRRIFEPIIGSDRLPSGKTPQDAGCSRLFHALSVRFSASGAPDWLTTSRRIWAVQIGKCLSTKGPVSSVVVCHVGLPTGVNHDTIQPALIHSAFLLVGTSTQRRQYSMPLPL
jgi:hypothetical protein